MTIAALLAAVLVAPASAQVQVQTCKSNEMTAAWEKITFGLWLSDYTIPESGTRLADLKYKGCAAGDKGESRTYSSEDGSITVTAVTDAGGDNGATTLALSRGGAGVTLGTWGHHKVFYKGVGIDKVALPNGGRPLVKNVFVIPVSWGEKN